MTAAPRVRVGVGGWTFPPWRDNFYPPGLPHHRELHHASRALSAIEVNGTFYSTFTPKTFAKWRDETPEGFVFTLKAHRSTTVRRELATAREAIDRFLGSGVSELGPKLGAIVWQFQPTKRFSPCCRPVSTDWRCAMCWRCGIPASKTRPTCRWRAAMAA
jgi:uncharacterized protein YecE (DUF72 family)